MRPRFFLPAGLVAALLAIVGTWRGPVVAVLAAAVALLAGLAVREMLGSPILSLPAALVALLFVATATVGAAVLLLLGGLLLVTRGGATRGILALLAAPVLLSIAAAPAFAIPALAANPAAWRWAAGVAAAVLLAGARPLAWLGLGGALLLGATGGTLAAVTGLAAGAAARLLAAHPANASWVHGFQGAAVPAASIPAGGLFLVAVGGGLAGAADGALLSASLFALLAGLALLATLAGTATLFLASEPFARPWLAAALSSWATGVVVTLGDWPEIGLAALGGAAAVTAPLAALGLRRIFPSVGSRKAGAPPGIASRVPPFA